MPVNDEASLGMKIFSLKIQFFGLCDLAAVKNLDINTAVYESAVLGSLDKALNIQCYLWQYPNKRKAKFKQRMLIHKAKIFIRVLKKNISEG